MPLDECKKSREFNPTSFEVKEKPIKILEWNINQRSNTSGLELIPEWVADEIKRTVVDIAVLTEFCKTDNWIQALAYKLENYNVFTNNNEEGNEILIAVKKEMKVLGLKEKSDSDGWGNFLEIQLESEGKPYTIIGFRTRVCEKNSEEFKNQQLQKLCEYLKYHTNEKVVVVGDFNLWDSFTRDNCPIPEGFEVKAPAYKYREKAIDKWSFVFENGNRAPIDFAITNAKVIEIDYSWDYISRTGFKADGYKSAQPGIPDHAMLLLKVK